LARQRDYRPPERLFWKLARVFATGKFIWIAQRFLDRRIPADFGKTAENSRFSKAVCRESPEVLGFCRMRDRYRRGTKKPAGIRRADPCSSFREV
jgi:hypothetical protein